MRNPRIPLASLAAGAALLLALAGCSDDSGDGGSDGDQKASAKTTDVVAETTWPYQSTEGEAKVEVHAPRVRGKLMQLTLTVTAKDPSAEGYDYENLYNLFGTNGVSPSLVDPSDLKRYTVVTDSDDALLAPDPVNTDLYDGKAKDLSFTFAAPPEGVESLDLYVNEFPPVTDLPVVR